MKMKIGKVSAQILAFLLVISAAGCIKDEIDLNNISDKIYWNPSIGVPIAYGNLTIEDLIESIDSKQNIREDSEKFLSLIYSNTLLSESAASILKIQNQTFNEVLLESQYNLPPLPIQDTIVLSRNSKHTFSFSYGEVIDSVKLKTGTMIFNVSSSYKYNGKLKIVVPKLVKDKKPLEVLVDINKSDGTFTSTQNFDLSGYKLELEHPNVNDNLMSYSYTAKLVNSGNGVSVGDNISININFNDITFSSLYGYIGQRQLINTQSEFIIPVFQNVSQPNLSFANPSMTIRTINSFGVPASVELYNTQATNSKNNQTVQLTFTPGINPFRISYPSAPGNSARDTSKFSNTTTNLNDALAIAPDKIFYGIRSFANPEGRTLNYVTDSSRVSIELDVELPLDMKTSQVEFTDTMKVDFLSDLGDDTEKIKSMLLHTSFENGMPVDLNLQVYLLNENYSHVDTLFNTKIDNLIKSGTLNQQGKVTGATKKDLDIQFTKSEIDALKTVRHAIIKAGVITANGGNTFVKFYSDYSIKVNFGVQTELEINED